MSIGKKNNKVDVCLHHSLPSGGAKKLFTSNLNYLNKYINLEVIEEKFIAKNFLHYLFYVVCISRKIAKKLSKVEFVDKKLLVVHHSWFLKSPYVLRFAKIPTIYVCHEPPREYHDKEHIKLQGVRERLINILRLPIKYIDKRNAQSATVIVSNSKFSHRLIKSAYDRESIIIYPGISSNKKQSKSIKNQVITVGAINKLKRQLFFVEVLAKINEESRPELVIISNGCDSNYKRKIVFSGLKNNVKIRILENVSDDEKMSEIGRSISFLYAPVNEPFGIAILEALSIGLPILYYEYGGGYSEILNKKCGIGLATLDLDIWAQGLTRILSYSTRQLSLIKNNNIAISKKYDELTFNKHMFQLIKSNL